MMLFLGSHESFLGEWLGYDLTLVFELHWDCNRKSDMKEFVTSAPVPPSQLAPGQLAANKDLHAPLQEANASMSKSMEGSHMMKPPPPPNPALSDTP